MKRVRRRSRQSDDSEREYGECRYEARSWDDERRVIIKAQVLQHAGRAAKDNPRFVVTNLTSSQPSFIYDTVYCARGRMEGYIKNHKNGLQCSTRLLF